MWMGGEWIWCAGETGKNQYVDFVRAFTYDGSGPLSLAVSVDTQYVAYLNGEVAAWGQYPDYPWYKVAETADISRHARVGENRLCIQAYHDGEASSVYHPGKAALRFAVMQEERVLCQSGPGTQSRPSPEYVSGEMDKVSPQLSYSFAYRADRQDAWLREDALGFAPSALVQQAPTLHERPIEKLVLQEPVPAGIIAQGTFLLKDPACASAAARMQDAYLSTRLFGDLTGSAVPLPAAIAQEGIPFVCGDGDGIYVLVDLGAEQAGFLDLCLHAPKGTRVDVGYGEHLHDLRIRTHVGGRCFGAEITAGSGKTRLRHLFKRIAGRYLQLFVYAKEFHLLRLSICPVEMPYAEQGAFSSSDHLHNEIYRTAVHTLRLCMHEHFEDCPLREQALYGMDSRNQMLFSYYVFGSYGYARASLRLLAAGQREDGLLPICAPSQVPITIPGFSLFWVIALYEQVLFSRDLAFGREMLGCAARILDAFLSRQNAEGLLSRFVQTPYWNFYEWQPGLDGEFISREHTLSERLEAPLNALLAYTLSRMSSLCGMLGEPATVYRETYDRIAAAFHAAFWDADRSLYRTFVKEAHYSAYVNALAIQAGLCPEQHRPAVLAELAAPAPDVVRATLSSDIFRYEALLQEPRYQKQVLDEIAGVYGRMLFAGATSFWETERGAWDFDLAGSLCHGWSAVPVYLYYAYVLGLRPTEDGGYALQPVQSGIGQAQGNALVAGRQIHVQVEDGVAVTTGENA